MKIQIAGPGCPRCKATEKVVLDACAELALAAEVSKVEDPRQMAALGVRLTPAVVVDGKVVIAGRVPTLEEVKELLAGLR